MNQPHQPQVPEQVTSNPEGQGRVADGVPDDQSSKVGSKKPDARTPHDKDGNQEQAANNPKAS